MNLDFCRFVSSKGSKKERMIHGRYLLSFDERQKALEGFDKAMCKIFRLAESHTSVVIYRTNVDNIALFGGGSS